MNGLCSACKQPVEVVDFRLAEGLVVVRCTACGKQQRLSISEASGSSDPVAAPPARAPSPVGGPPQVLARPTAPGRAAFEPSFEPPQGFCPKCIAPRTQEATSCPACGLVFSNASRAPEPSSPLAAAFRALGARWEDNAGHVQFLQLAHDSGELAVAGRLYRIRLAEAPNDAVARTSLEAAVKLASAPVSVASIKSAPVDVGLQRRKKQFILMAVALLGPPLLLALVRLLGRN